MGLWLLSTDSVVLCVCISHPGSESWGSLPQITSSGALFRREAVNRELGSWMTVGKRFDFPKPRFPKLLGGGGQG